MLPNLSQLLLWEEEIESCQKLYLGYALGEFVYATKGLSVLEALPLILKDILSLAPRFKCHIGFTSPVTLSFLVT